MRYYRSESSHPRSFKISVVAPSLVLTCMYLYSYHHNSFAIAFISHPQHQHQYSIAPSKTTGTNKACHYYNPEVAATKSIHNNNNSNKRRRRLISSTLPKLSPLFTTTTTSLLNSISNNGDDETSPDKPSSSSSNSQDDRMSQYVTSKDHSTKTKAKESNDRHVVKPSYEIYPSGVCNGRNYRDIKMF